jgi:HK97 family phage portal protein
MSRPSLKSFLMQFLGRSVASQGYTGSMSMDFDMVYRPSKTGVSVTESSSLQSVAVWSCVRILSETMASLPLFLYKRLPRGKGRAIDHSLYTLLHDQPNPEMTSFTFREVLMAHLVTWGNAYAEIEYDTDKMTVKALWPLRPDMMRVERNKGTGQITYGYSLPYGAGQAALPAYKVLHIPGLGFDGIMGYSPITMAREAIGLSLATEEFGARFFSGGATPGGVLEHPQKMSDDAKKRLKVAWNEMHQGLSNQHRIAILEEGMKFNKIGIPLNDAQFLETRKFQKNEIAALFHVPPHMIGDLERATFSNIEEQALEFVVYTMRPWLVRWEQAINWKLLTAPNDKGYFAEFMVDALLRGNIQARYAAYATGRQWGWLSANDIRELENQNPIDQGNDYLIPLNMVPAGDQQMSFPPAKTLKSRSKNGASLRQRTARSYSNLFESAGYAIVKKERAEVLKSAKEHLSTKTRKDFSESWDAWLNNFYREFEGYVKGKIRPIIDSMVEAITPLAADEINSAPVISKDFNEKYVTNFTRQYVVSSKGQLSQIVRDSTKNNVEPLTAIEERLDEWGERRPGKIAMNETVACSNAVAKAVFIAAGITKLVWANMGDKPCDFCEELDGQVVGIEKQFSTSGLSSAGHPPIHEGCQCQIVPE